jgi:hypothetical protein
MTQFFICFDNPHNVALCVGSRDAGRAIAVAGVPVDGGVVQMFAGIVDSIDHDPKRGSNREWLVTMNHPR